MWRMGVFLFFFFINIVRSFWIFVKGESFRGIFIYLSILVKNIDFIFVVELNFKVLIFYVYVLLEEIVVFFFKINIIVYNISYIFIVF